MEREPRHADQRPMGEATFRASEQPAGHHMAGHDHMGTMDMMRQQFLQERWSQFVVVALGGWLAAAPAAFGYGGALAWSDAITGALVAVLGLLSIRYERGWARWANTGLGIWLLFAPLVFWTAAPAAYINDTLVGALVIGLALLVPGMPGMLMLPGPEVPPGWTYNPSTWLQRAPPIALALISFLIARYLAAFQLGYIGHAWDPFFGESTVRVLTSRVSRAWPISDAGLGAVSYLLEALSGFMGHRDRWRTMPWMVLMFGFLVVPLGIVSIVLVILQPVAVGHWCTLCLLTALFMLVMIPFAVDEVVAMGQFLVTAHRQRQPFWTTFWRGGTPDPHATTREPAPATFDSPLPEQAVAMARGITLPWSLLVSAGLGLWLMAAPGVLGYGGATADSDHLVGPLVVVVAVIAMAEVVRPLRYLNLLFAAWLVAAPWLLGGASGLGVASDLLVGIALALSSLPRGPIRQRYGGWDRFLGEPIWWRALRHRAPRAPTR